MSGLPEAVLVLPNSDFTGLLFDHVLSPQVAKFREHFLGLVTELSTKLPQLVLMSFFQIRVKSAGCHSQNVPLHLASQ